MMRETNGLDTKRMQTLQTFHGFRNKAVSQSVKGILFCYVR
jgi:hypothetical protein